jgi:hypothetical protein
MLLDAAMGIPVDSTDMLGDSVVNNPFVVATFLQ